MSPELSTAMAVVSIIDKLGGWSVGGGIFFVLITPAFFVYLAARIVTSAINGLKAQMATSEQESQKRFQTFEAKYDNNIRFVEDYERLASGLDDTLRRNTIAMTKLVARIDTVKEIKP